MRGWLGTVDVSCEWLVMFEHMSLRLVCPPHFACLVTSSMMRCSVNSKRCRSPPVGTR